MGNDSTNKRAGQQNSGNRGASRQSKDADTAAVGDNRRAGDVDGNKTGGHSKSRGASEATDDADEAPPKGA
jgi:hypothetical protein